jgi:signal transduction histidine kinase
LLGNEESASPVDSYRKQETVLILLNILVLAALFFTHISFMSLLGAPSALLLGTLSVRFIILIFELLWLQRLEPDTSPLLLSLHTHFSVWFNIAVAFAASNLSGMADSHYSVLMVIPIITAAYRWKLSRTLLVIAVAIILTFLEVWLYFFKNPPADVTEYFEAATVSLIFLVVGIVVRLLVGSLREKEQQLEGSLTRLGDMQERLVAEEKLAAMGQLSGAIAHEIRNPVAMIASSLQMAGKEETVPSLKEEMFGIALAESRRLETLTGDFLSYARTMKPVRERSSVMEVLEYAAISAKAKFVEKDLSSRIECGNGAAVDMDKGLIRQALLNLVVNAVDAAPPGSAIVLGCTNSGKDVALYVENSGGSVDPDSARRLFEPFFTTKTGGTGLGLAIVRNIARSHGGDAVFASNENGKVRFEIRLPLRKGEEEIGANTDS